MAVFLLAVSFLSAPVGPLYPFGAAAQAQEYYYGNSLTREQLDNLLAPVALYPDPLLAQLLVAATFEDEIQEAARWLRYYNDPYGIDGQPWDISVRAIAHYPSVLYMMADGTDWTVALGQAYASQPGDVMAAIQRLRWMAHSAGNLVSGSYHQVLVSPDIIEIVPYQPAVIYVPAYEPDVIFVRRATFITFGHAFPIGAWLNRDCDWRGRRIYYHGWHGSRHWIDRSRPHVRITNIYVNQSHTSVRVNRDVFRRSVNFNRLNRYARVHREVNYDNRNRGDSGERRHSEAVNGTIRREGDPRKTDSFRGGQPPADRGVSREEKHRSFERGTVEPREERAGQGRERRSEGLRRERSLPAKPDTPAAPLEQTRPRHDRSLLRLPERPAPTQEDGSHRSRNDRSAPANARSQRPPNPPRAKRVERRTPQTWSGEVRQPRNTLRERNFDPRASRERESVQVPGPQPPTSASPASRPQERRFERVDRPRRHELEKAAASGAGGERRERRFRGRES